MKKVVITGGSGFIGSSCIRPLLSLGFEVHNFDLSPFHIEDPGYFYHKVNLLDHSSILNILKEIKASYLLHMAWYTEHGKFWNSTKNIIWTATSLQLVESFYDLGGIRALVAGTCAEYDWSNCNPLESKSSPLSPQNLYGSCKKALYEVLRSLALSLNKQLAWGRIFHLYGPGEPSTRLFPYVIDQLLQKKECPTTHGRQWRDFIHVNDVGRVFAHVLDSNFVGPFNVSSGTPIQLIDVVKEIAKMTGGLELIKFGAIEARNQPDSILADISDLKNMKFKFKYPLNNGIYDYIQVRKKELNLN